MAFYIFKEGDSTTSLSLETQTSAWSHSSKEFLLQLDSAAFQLVPFAASPVTGYHWKEPGYVGFAPSLQVFVNIDETPLLSLLSSRLSSLGCLSLSSYERYFSPFIIVVAATSAVVGI